MDKYILDEDTLTELVEAKNKLEALEEAGVDNWDGYDEAMQNVDDVDLSEYQTPDNNIIDYDEYDEE